MTRGALNAKAQLRTITNEDVERFERQGSQYERRRKGLSTPRLPVRTMASQVWNAKAPSTNDGVEIFERQGPQYDR